MSDYLFARPSFIEGVARNVDLFASLNDYNYSSSSEEADRRAQFEDIKALMNDMAVAESAVLGANGHRC